MRNLIFGGIGLLWGGHIVRNVLLVLCSGKFFTGSDPYFNAGSVFGSCFGFLMFGAGLSYFVKGCQQIYAGRMRREQWGVSQRI